MLANYWIAKLQKTIILFLNVLKICFIQIPNESKILLSEGLIFLQPFFGVIIRQSDAVLLSIQLMQI